MWKYGYVIVKHGHVHVHSVEEKKLIMHKQVVHVLVHVATHA